MKIFLKDKTTLNFSDIGNAAKRLCKLDISDVAGFDNEKLAYLGGLIVEGKDTKDADDLIASNLTLFEHRYKKGEIKDNQLDPGQVTLLKNRTKGAK